MKKFIVLFLAGFLILAFGATVYGQDKLEFRAHGFIDNQSHWSMNVPPLNPGAVPLYASAPGDYNSFDALGGRQRALNKYVGYWDTRFSLRFEAAMGKNLSGVLQFEIDAARWGNSLAGARPNSEAHSLGQWTMDRTGIEVKYMYVDFGMPYFGVPIPVTVRVGGQPLAVRPWFLQANDGMGVSFGIKIDPVTINPLYFKMAEGVDWVADDVDIWGLQLSARLGTVTVGGYGLYYDMNNYPIGGNAYFVNPPHLLPVYNAGVHDADFWWFGLFADGKVGPVNLMFDFGYDHGKVKNGIAGSIAPDVKYRGWATKLKVDYPIEKFNVGLVGMYASGSDANKTAPNGLPGTIGNDGTFSDKVRGWVVPPGSEQAPASGASMMDSVVFYGQDPGASGGQGWGVNITGGQAHKGSLGGTWFAKLYGSYKATPWYKVTLQGLYIGDTTKHGNTIGTAQKYGGTIWQTNRDSSNIGFEMDMINEFQIYKNLTFKVFGGYLWAGSAMDLYTGNPFVGNFEMKNPWAIRTKLFYAF